MKQPSIELIRKWYKKLKASGFKDIENEDGSLTQSPRMRYGVENVQQYYDHLMQLCHSISPAWKLRFPELYGILEMYANGMCDSEITEALAGPSERTVDRVLVRWKEIAHQADVESQDDVHRWIRIVFRRGWKPS